MQNIVEETRGKWPSLLSALGFSDANLSGKHGPCPFCGGKDRFRFDRNDLNGKWICAQCGHGDGFEMVKRRHIVDFKGAIAIIKPLLGAAIIEPKREEVDKKAVMRGWFKEAKRLAKSDLGWSYLDSRCAPIRMEMLGDFWLHPGLKHPDGVFSCILALTRDQNGEPCGCQRLFLNPDGTKHGKGMTYGEIGSGVRFSRRNGNDERVIVGEGVETVLCAMHRFGLPGFATLGAVLEKWEPPTSVQSVVIAADNDKNFSGQKYAYCLARRLAVELKLDVEVRVSPDAGTDWADQHEFIGAE